MEVKKYDFKISVLEKGMLVLISILLMQCSKKNDDSVKGTLAIIPNPVTWKAGEGYFTIDKHTTLYPRLRNRE